MKERTDVVIFIVIIFPTFTFLTGRAWWGFYHRKVSPSQSDDPYVFVWVVGPV
jgi:hypothetical protein